MGCSIHFNHDRAHVRACNAGTVNFPITGMIGITSIPKPGFMHLSVWYEGTGPSFNRCFMRMTPSSKPIHELFADKRPKHFLMLGELRVYWNVGGVSQYLETGGHIVRFEGSVRL